MADILVDNARAWSSLPWISFTTQNFIAVRRSIVSKNTYSLKP